MRKLILYIPDNFTKEQEEFILKSAANQIETEIMKEATIPQNIIDAAKLKVTKFKTAMKQTKQENEITEK